MGKRGGSNGKIAANLIATQTFSAFADLLQNLIPSRISQRPCNLFQLAIC